MSHEIRTPLNSILGFSELLQGSEVARSERDQFVQTILRNGNHLLRLIDDILDLSRVEASHLKVDKIPVNINGLLNDLDATFTKMAKNQGIVLKFIEQGNIPKIIESDGVRLKQILINLISNALKFTKSGGEIIVSTFYRDDRSELKFSVKDTGCGIAEDQIDRIFEPFYQVDKEMNRAVGGVGLGLSLSRKLANLIGGNLYLEQTRLGVGSTFVLIIPVETKVKFSLGAASSNARAINGMKILTDHSSDG